MALEKTEYDLKLRDELKKAAAAGKYDEELLKKLSVEKAIERTIAARDKTMAQRLTEGRSVDDLKAITNDVITRAAHYQQSEMFAIDRLESDSKLKKDKELDEQLRRMHEA